MSEMNKEELPSPSSGSNAKEINNNSAESKQEQYSDYAFLQAEEAAAKRDPRPIRYINGIPQLTVAPPLFDPAHPELWPAWYSYGPLPEGVSDNESENESEEENSSSSSSSAQSRPNSPVSTPRSSSFHQILAATQSSSSSSSAINTSHLLVDRFSDKTVGKNRNNSNFVPRAYAVCTIPISECSQLSNTPNPNALDNESEEKQTKNSQVVSYDNCADKEQSALESFNEVLSGFNFGGSLPPSLRDFQRGLEQGRGGMMTAVPITEMPKELYNEVFSKKEAEPSEHTNRKRKPKTQTLNDIFQAGGLWGGVKAKKPKAPSHSDTSSSSNSMSK
jgi:hypothetical protein